MLLNEDFFNDIEIKDEDLTVEQPVKEYNEKTPRELIEHKMSESEMVLTIRINYFYGDFDIWHRIERIMKRVKYMFDIYNINISDPFLMCNSILNYKYFPDNYTIIQHKGCNLYFPEDELREYGPDKVIMKKILEVFVFLDKKIPVFKTAMSAYNFAVRLDKCIWKDITNDRFGCFNWYGLYNINDVYTDVINSFASSNSYINNDGSQIYESVLNIVPEELAEQLEKKRNLLQLDNEKLKTQDVKEIIKLAEQQRIL